MYIYIYICIYIYIYICVCVCVCVCVGKLRGIEHRSPLLILDLYWDIIGFKMWILSYCSLFITKFYSVCIHITIQLYYFSNTTFSMLNQITLIPYNMHTVLCIDWAWLVMLCHTLQTLSLVKTVFIHAGYFFVLLLTFNIQMSYKITNHNHIWLSFTTQSNNCVLFAVIWYRVIYLKIFHSHWRIHRIALVPIEQVTW